MNKPTDIKQSPAEQHVLNLLNGSVDGELSAAEQAELDELLANSAHVRAMNEELKALAGVLDGLPEREPPEYLHHVITSQAITTISRGRLPAVGGAQGDKPGSFRRWLAMPWMRTGLGVTAGLLLTVSIYQTGSENLSPADTSDMTGTVMKNPRGALLDSTRFNAEALNGKAELRYKDGLLSVDVYLESDGRAALNLDLSGQDLQYAGIIGLPDQAGNVAVADDSISVAGSGLQHYAVLLKRKVEVPGGNPGPLRLEFFADNVLIHKAELGRSR